MPDTLVRSRTRRAKTGPGNTRSFGVGAYRGPDKQGSAGVGQEDYLWECFLVSAISTDSVRIKSAVAISA